MNNADVRPQELVSEADDAVDAESFELLGTACDDFGDAALAFSAGGGVVDGGRGPDGCDEVTSILGAGS